MKKYIIIYEHYGYVMKLPIKALCKTFAKIKFRKHHSKKNFTILAIKKGK